MSHSEAATRFTRDEERTQWHDRALWFVRARRDQAASALVEWEELRVAAAAIKAHTLSKLADYLEEFADRAAENGIHVHWARDAAEHNRIVHEILEERGAKRLVKSKSMLTEECHLNPYLEERGIEVVDTDLGERIVQLRREPPSHIVMPAIHLKKEEVGELFAERLDVAPGISDPQVLTEAARSHLRQIFLDADAALTGVNFAIAETGGFVVVTNEGNADLGVSLPGLHIASMGIEKLVPRIEHLGIFLRLLARSATGQAITTYTSHFHRPRPGAELHLVLVDNGRTELLGDADFQRSLACIRCGACMNTCPVYRRSGGHSYGTTVPGPIGSVLSPLRDPARHGDLAFASSLCGSCTDVCPVKIDLHHQLLSWRRRLLAGGHVSRAKRAAFRAAGWVLRSRRCYEWSSRLLRAAGRCLPARWRNRLSGTWGRQRELPEPPRNSFRELYRRRGDAS